MNAIIKEGLVCIFRGIPQDKVVDVAKAEYAGGVRVIEVAFDPAKPETAKDTAAAIKAIKDALPSDATVGAGTVVNTDLVKTAHSVGADFIFSPNFDPDVVALTKQLGMISIPGAYTPSECAAAYKAGADVIKLFPVTVNELGYIVNIMRPLDYIPFICVGGTNENTIEDFFSVGALGVGVGLALLPAEMIENGDYSGLEERAKMFISKVRECQQKYKR